MRETANEQSRANQQYQRKYKLGDDEQLTQATLPFAGRTSGALLQRKLRVLPRRLPRRGHAEEQSRQQRHEQRKAEHTGVGRDWLQLQHLCRAETGQQFCRSEEHTSELQSL